jgi:amino acid transporter
MLAYIVAGIGVVIVLAGVAIAAVPGFIREFLADLEPKFIYAAVGARLLTGAFLVFASEACSWPEAVGTFGVIALAAGFIGLFMGIDRINALISWFAALSDTAVRSIMLAAIFVGVFLVYAAKYYEAV